MGEKEDLTALFLLITGLIVGASIGYFVSPLRVEPMITPAIIDLPPRSLSIKLGYIASDTTALEVGKPYHEKIISADLNNYAKLLGYPVTISYLIDDAQGQDSTHLEKVQGLRSMGVTVFESGGWSSQAQSALNYVNKNGMLMWSPSSTSPTLAISDDNLFRMCPTDINLAPAMVNVMWAAGVRSIVIFQRGDSWGDGIVNLLVPLWIAKGGEISGEKVRYATNATDFDIYLSTADREVRDAVTKYFGDTQKVGIVMLTARAVEISPILREVSSYTNMSSVHWWWSNDETATIYRVMDDAPEEASSIGVYCILPHVTQTPLYSQLESRYENLTKQQFSSYQAYSYDISLVISNSIYQMQSTSGAVLVPLQKPTADRTFGSTGSCRLDGFGDRIGPSYDVWGFYPSPTGGIVSLMVGRYNPDAEEIKEGDGTVLFFPEAMGGGVPGP